MLSVRVGYGGGGEHSKSCAQALLPNKTVCNSKTSDCTTCGGDGKITTTTVCSHGYTYSHSSSCSHGYTYSHAVYCEHNKSSKHD